jgi:ABC-type spermidine/putrescine transport system permease subunit I
MAEVQVGVARAGRERRQIHVPGLRYGLLALPLAYVFVLFVVPLALTFVWSLWRREGFWMTPDVSLAAYRDFFGSDARRSVLERTAVLSVVATVVGLLIAYPIAYLMAMRLPRELSRTLLLLFTIPFVVNYIIRDISWVYLLDRNGPVNDVLTGAGISDTPVDWLLYSNFAVTLGLVTSFMPFMIFPLWLALAGLDRRLIEASWTLGASPAATFFRVTLPLSIPGIFAAIIFGFVGSFGESAVPQILGGSGFQMMGNTITSALGILNYPLAAAMSSIVVAAMLLLLAVWFWLFDARSLFGKIERWRY